MTIESIGKKMDALNAWDVAMPCRWAVKPRGCVFPYFCCTAKGEIPQVKIRFLMLDGWQTFHDFIRWNIDHDFGFIYAPVELPHFELVILQNGAMKVFRNDPGYVPREATKEECKRCAKILWESYGIMLRLESDSSLPLRYADELAMFARVEDAKGNWHDKPLTIIDPRPHVEKVFFAKKALSAAKDLPIRKDEVWELDVQLVPGIMTQEQGKLRPRLLYLLAAVDARTNTVAFRDKLVMDPEGGLRALWEGIPPRILEHFIERKAVPGELRTRSGRVFRLMRPLCVDLSFKLSRMTNLPNFGTALKNLI